MSDSTRVLVTAASRGLGRELAIQLERAGYEVIATARSRADLEDLDCAQRLSLDVADENSIAAAVDEAERVDVLVNCAGVEAFGAIEDVDDQALEAAFLVNAVGPIRVARAVVPRMRERASGAIVNVSSMGARFAPPLYGSYAASKAALEVLGATLRFEVQPFGIAVTTAILGDIDHEMNDGLGATHSGPYADLASQHAERLEQHGDRDRATLDEVAGDIVELIEEGDFPESKVLGGRVEQLMGLVPRPLARRLARSGLEWPRSEGSRA